MRPASRRRMEKGKLTGTLDMQLSGVADLICDVNSPQGYVSFKATDDG